MENCKKCLGLTSGDCGNHGSQTFPPPHQNTLIDMRVCRNHPFGGDHQWEYDLTTAGTGFHCRMCDIRI